MDKGIMRMEMGIMRMQIMQIIQPQQQKQKQEQKGPRNERRVSETKTNLKSEKGTGKNIS